jgi:hypothetical protein
MTMDGISGFKRAGTEEVHVMVPIHVIQVAPNALDECLVRTQQAAYGHQWRVGDPLYTIC